MMKDTSKNLGMVAILLGCLISLGVASLWAENDEASTPSAPSGTEQAAASPASGISEGKAIYEKRCSQCHGMEGRGDGVTAERLRPRPANFARAKYKYASTEKDELPTDDDLFRTVTKGLPGTAMPAWEEVLSEKDRRAVIQYIKTFSDKFAEQQGPPKMIQFGKKIPPSKESIAKGKELFFQKAECNRCHGDEGRSDGKNAAELSVWPRNFTKGWTFRRGNSPEEIFQRITRGIVVMPSFAKGENVETTEEERWHIANYVHSLSQSNVQPEVDSVVRASLREGALPPDPNDPAWEAVGQYYFPLVGQVVQEKRLFTPTVDGIWVQAVYNQKEVSFRLIWDDPTTDGAKVEVPVEQPPAAPAAAESAAGAIDTTNETNNETNMETIPPLPPLIDRIGIQIPVLMPGEGVDKPYFLRGDSKTHVTLARWGSEGAMDEANYTGLDKRFQKETTTFKGTGVYKNGRYHVVITRPLITTDKKNDLQIEAGKFIPISFSAWDSYNNETDSMMSVSSWYYLLLEPPLPSTRYIYPTLFAFCVIGIEFWIIRKYGKRR